MRHIPTIAWLSIATLACALLFAVLGAVFGCTLGFVAAHFRGWVEETIMMVVDIQASLPFILIALTLLAFFGNSFGLLILLMAMFGWDSYARLSRGVVLSAKSQPWAEAVRTLGVPPVALYLRHVLAMCVLGDWLRDRLDPALQRLR